MITCLAAVLNVNPFTIPLNEVENILNTIVESQHLADHTDDVFSIMKSVGIISDKLVDKFFLSSLEVMKKESVLEVLKIATRYNFFHSAYTGIYYNKEFEKKVIEHLVKQFKTEGSYMLLYPKAVAEMTAILITFGHPVTNEIFVKFQQMLPQMCPRSLFHISKAIEHQTKKHHRDKLNLSMNPIPRRDKSPQLEVLDQMSILVNRASEATIRDDFEGNYSVVISSLLRNFLARNDIASENFTVLTDKLQKKVESGALSNKIVNQICSSVNSRREKLEAPKLTESLVSYYLTRPEPEEVHLSSMVSLLENCFRSGNKPHPEFLKLVNHSLLRDIDSISGQRTLNVAFILSHYSVLTESLAQAVFSNEFMAKLDAVIKCTAE